MAFFTSSFIFLVQFVNHSVPTLYPKKEWLSLFTHLKWNFLFPFTGGSGPTGFYISFLFISFAWILSIFLIVYGRSKFISSKEILFLVLVLGIFYNVIFTEEYLFGKINGSSYGLFEEVKQFIVNDKNIKKIMVYNDIGGYEIQKLGKYERRIYAAPQFESVYKPIFIPYDGHVLFIDIPRVNPNSLYANFFAVCSEIYKKNDKYITAKILDCSKRHIP